jgi:peptide/nickel transport system substrate-binding protein
VTGRARRPALVAIALLALAGLAGAADPRGELRVGIPWTPENLDPTMNLSSIRATVGASIFDSLVGRDRDNRIVPELAESWKLINDTTWQLKLRRGVVFHNGELFNAEAVRFTFERVLDPNQKSPNRANVGEVAKVEVVDELTVNLITGRPYAPLINRLIDFPMVPPKYTAEKGNQGLALRPVGTGPYRLVSFVKDEQLTVEAFDRHWRGTPGIARIVFKPVPEPFTRAAALRNGEVDLITTVPPSLAGELERVAGVKVHRVPSSWQIYLGLNAFKKPLADVRVRQALNFATDRNAITAALFPGAGSPTSELTVPGGYGYDPALANAYPYDPGKARQLLAAAGYLHGFTLRIVTGEYGEMNLVAQALAQQWKKVGITLQVTDYANSNQYFSAAFGATFPAFMTIFGQLPIWMEGPSLFLPPASFNPFHTASPALAALYAQEARSSGTAQAALDRQIEAYLVHQAWFVPVVTTGLPFYATQAVTGTTTSAEAPLLELYEVRAAG